jgi:hypothetical protein
MVTIYILRDFLLWCAIINYAIIFGWFLAFTCAHQALYRLHSRWFRLSADQFDAIHYLGMAAYKIVVLSFNVAPYIALCITASRGI